MSGEPEVLFDVDRGVGRITLNQPRILNALNFTMVREIDPKPISRRRPCIVTRSTH